MTAISIADLPLNARSGTGKRRILIFVKGVAVGAAQVRNLANDLSGLSDIEGVFLNTDGGVTSSTAVTWSTTTLTIPAHISGNEVEVDVIGTMT